MAATTQQEGNNNTAQPSTELPQGNRDNNTAGNALRAVRHSKSHHMPSGPTTSHFYPAAWQIVIERAKHKFIRHIFLNQGFLVRDKHLDIAEDLLHLEIARGEAENLALDNSKIHFILVIQCALR